MRRVTPEEQREMQLRMLKIFADFCEEHNLRYSLGGGTLLGAVRHKGFIPWDDDIDVMMPRPDYEYFLKNFDGSSTNTRLSYYLHNENHLCLYAKLYDNRTIVISKELEEALYIDIFPIDFFSSTEKVNEMWGWLYNIKMYNFRIKYRRNENIFIRIWYRILWEFHLLKYHRYMLWKYSHKWIYLKFLEIVKSSNPEDSVFGGAVVGSYVKKELMKSYVFLEYDKLPFEGRYFMCIKHFDLYLSQHYGNYLILPDKCDRIPSHGLKAFWIEG